MATYSRTTSTNTDTQTSSLPAVRQPMQSVELAQIIVHSMEVVSDALESGDVPVNVEQITEAINKSDITNAVSDGITKSKSLEEKIYKAVSHALKDHDRGMIDQNYGGKDLPSRSGGSGRSGAANAMQSYWEQKKFNDEKKQRDKQAKLEAEERKRREQDITKRLDETFANLNKFSNNPLKGTVDAFEKGIKKFFNTSLGDVTKHMKKGFDVAVTPFKLGGKALGEGAKLVGKTAGGVLKGVGAIGRGIGGVITGGIAVGSLIKDRVKSGSEGGAALGSLIEEDKNPRGGLKDKLANLLTKESKDEKATKKEEKKDRDEQGKVLKNISKATDMIQNLTLIKFGAILAAVGGIAVAIPQIVGLLGPFINNIPWYLDDIKTKIGLLFTGENSIGNQIKWAGIDLLQRLGEGMAKSDNGVISSLGKGILSGTAAGAQEELAEQFKQSESYQNLLRSGMKAEDIDTMLKEKGWSAIASMADAMNNSDANFTNKTNISYTDTKGKSKTKNVKVGDVLGHEEFFENDEKAKEIRNKMQRFGELWTNGDIEEAKAGALTNDEINYLKKYLSNLGMPPIYVEAALKPYVQMLNLSDWTQVLMDREEGKLKTDTNKLRAEAKAKDEETFLQQQALNRMVAAQNEGVSLLDFQTDKAWETNPYLKDIKDEYMSKYATELSGGEKILASGIEASDAGKRLFGNAAANVTGNSNSWQTAVTIKMDSPDGGSGLVTY